MNGGIKHTRWGAAITLSNYVCFEKEKQNMCLRFRVRHSALSLVCKGIYIYEYRFLFDSLLIILNKCKHTEKRFTFQLAVQSTHHFIKISFSPALISLSVMLFFLHQYYFYRILHCILGCPFSSSCIMLSSIRLENLLLS